MAPLVLIRALMVRLMFACHGIITIWRLHVVTGDSRFWIICTALVLLVIESVVTIWKKHGKEWKWFCPCVFFFLLCTVPAIWFLELNELAERTRLKELYNVTDGLDTQQHANDTKDLSASFVGIGVEIRIPVKLSSDQWVRSLEQTLLLFLIVGRWLLPKGKITHDQLSQLLLVYIGTAADIVELFEAFKEEEVRYNKILCIIILAIWSWSLLQFSMVLTAQRVRNKAVAQGPQPPMDTSCCDAAVFGIVVSIFMQDAPFLVLRLLLIFKYDVVSYTNMFFTCKNTLVITLLLYRLIVIQLEKRTAMREFLYPTVRQSYTSGAQLLLYSGSSDILAREGASSPDQELIRESPDYPELPIPYVIKRHISFDAREAERKLSASHYEEETTTKSDYF